MKAISRKEVEDILRTNLVIDTQIEQNEAMIRVSLELENQNACIVHYDLKERTKTYLLSDATSC